MHPYKNFPERQFWNRSVSGVPWSEVFSGLKSKFTITSEADIASAGSCFSQRIAQHLLKINYGYKVYEKCHPLFQQESSEYGYDTFSCRYGNIYTVKQLKQLIDQAFGLRGPIFKFEKMVAGNVIDLMRPNINAMGFDSFEEAEADRIFHLNQVRKMFETVDYFIFTLGLTEAWVDDKNDLVYGTHPSVFTHRQLEHDLLPINYDYEEVFNDFLYIHTTLTSINPKIKFILTVSPVGLAATHQDKHVLLSTTYSKSVLRAVAGRLSDNFGNIDYFPSFEIFSLSQSFGQFLAEDLREISLRGVNVAMKTFENMFFSETISLKSEVSIAHNHIDLDRSSATDVECDEIANSFFANKF